MNSVTDIWKENIKVVHTILKKKT